MYEYEEMKYEMFKIEIISHIYINEGRAENNLSIQARVRYIYSQRTKAYMEREAGETKIKARKEKLGEIWEKRGRDRNNKK